MTIAGWPRRIGALFVDWVIALLTLAAFGGRGSSAFAPLIVFFVEVSLVGGLLGYSIGKRVFDIKIIGEDGLRIGLLRTIVRTFLLCLVIPAVITTDHQRGLHDLAAKSMVVRNS